MTPKQSTTPTPGEVQAARESIQATLGLGITAAQDWCAVAVHTERRAWQQWETEKGTTSHRKMHPAFWELWGIKAALIARKL